MSIVRAAVDRAVPTPEENEVVIYRSFFKARLRFPLSRFVVEVLKTYRIFLHHITPEAVIRMVIFVWAVRSQGQSQVQNVFAACTNFRTRRSPRVKNNIITILVLWLCCSLWLKLPSANVSEEMARGLDGRVVLRENDLKVREDIKEIIMRPIWSRFSLRKRKVEIDEAAEACRRAFSIVCSFIGTRDLVQEHVAYMIWPLIDSWEMPKETITNPSEGGLVRLKYTFSFGD
jgi:hypothetical protein